MIPGVEVAIVHRAFGSVVWEPSHRPCSLAPACRDFRPRVLANVYKATADSPVEDFAAEADRHPVFALTPVS